MMTKLMTLAAENGFSHWAPAAMDALTPRIEVRDMCRADRCGQWNANWACPPHCGTLEETAAAIRRFTAGLLVQTTGTLADDFDYEGMEAVQRRHKKSFSAWCGRRGCCCRIVCLCRRGPAPSAAAAPARTGPAAFRTSGCPPWRPTACWWAMCACAPACRITTAPAP